MCVSVVGGWGGGMIHDHDLPDLLQTQETEHLPWGTPEANFFDSPVRLFPGVVYGSGHTHTA